jgi:hypothetical protein
MYFFIDTPSGIPDEIRTPDPQLRRLLLYPTELRGQNWRKAVYSKHIPKGNHLFSKQRQILSALPSNMATRVGLEPMTTHVTGEYSDQLNYRAKIGARCRTRTYMIHRVKVTLNLSDQPCINWWDNMGSNHGPPPYQDGALPAELLSQ